MVKLQTVLLLSTIADARYSRCEKMKSKKLCTLKWCTAQLARLRVKGRNNWQQVAVFIHLLYEAGESFHRWNHQAD